MTRLPVFQPEPPSPSDLLDNLTIATPCEVPWDSLAGDDRVRHCGRCRQNVYNIESFERAEALRLIQAREGRLCLRLYRRVDGTLVTADCWARLRAARRRGLLAFAAALVVVGWAQLWAVAVGLYGLRSVVGRDRDRMMGAVRPSGMVAPRPAPEPPPPAREPGFTMGDMVSPPPPKAVPPPPQDMGCALSPRLMGGARTRAK